MSILRITRDGVIWWCILAIILVILTSLATIYEMWRCKKIEEMEEMENVEKRNKAAQTDQSSSDLEQLKRERDLHAENYNQLMEQIQRIEEENARLQEVNQQRQRQLENEIRQTWSFESKRTSFPSRAELDQHMNHCHTIRTCTNHDQGCLCGVEGTNQTVPKSENKLVQSATTTKSEKSTQTGKIILGQEVNDLEENVAIAINERDLLAEEIDNNIETSEIGTQTEEDPPSNSIYIQALEKSLISAFNERDLVVEENNVLEQQLGFVTENKSVQTAIITKSERSTQTGIAIFGQDIHELEENVVVAINERDLLAQKVETTEQATQTEAEPPSNPLELQELQESLIIAVNERDLFVEENENLERQLDLLTENYNEYVENHERLVEDYEVLYQLNEQRQLQVQNEIEDVWRL